MNPDALSLVDYAPVFERLVYDAARARDAREGLARFKRKADLTVEKLEASDRAAGDLRVRAIDRMLENIPGYARSESQRRFHRAFIGACLPHIYGTHEFERNRARVLAEHGLDKVQYEVLVCTPRRWGKTISVSMFCAALLYHVPDMWISCFSTGQRASSSLLDTVAKFICTMPDGDSRIAKKNQEQLFLRGNGPADVRRMFSYPSSVSGLKGVGGKIIILEEASRLDEAVFTEVVVPLFGVRDTVVLAISTPLDGDNYYSQMLEATRPDGSRLFNVLEVKLLCDECQAAGALSCPHKTEMPPWKTGERQELVKTLMASRNAEMYKREACGVITKSNSSAFNAAHVDALGAPGAAVGLEPLGVPRDIFCCIDPCGGGASAMAVATAVVTPTDTLIIVGADAANVSSDEELERFLHGHLDRVRDVRPLANSRIVLIIERNYGGAVLASRIANACAPYAPVAVMTQDGRGKLRRAGVVTTHQVKERCRVEFARMLRTRTVRFLQPFASASPTTPQDICTQLRAFHFAVKDGDDASGRGPKLYLTGKGYGKSDDLALVVQLLAFWPSTFLADGDACLL